LAGNCVVCKPNAVQCDPAGTNGTQTCDASGQWGAAVACPTTKPFCSANACSSTCPGTGGPSSVLLPLGYCIDSTEVTNGQYLTWLSTNPLEILQELDECKTNTDFAPSTGLPSAADANLPVVNVDWCDAYAYCEAVGKRLCGKIGGGEADAGDYQSASLNQWYSACSSYGANTYPYGNSYSATACNADNYDGTVAVKSKTTCQSSTAGYTGIYDMSGNVWEWEDQCNGISGASDPCRIRGGGYNSPDTNLTCAYNLTLARNASYDSLGFRCCSRN
jgi:formylglycine-generating enzyme required for sulfatase activity